MENLQNPAPAKCIQPTPPDGSRDFEHIANPIERLTARFRAQAEEAAAREAALTSEERDERDQQQREARERRIRAARHAVLQDFLRRVGRRYERASFTAFRCDGPKQVAAVEALKSYVKSFENEAEQTGGGIVLYGPAGTGKDHLLVATSGALIMQTTIADGHGGLMPLDYRPPIHCVNGMTFYGDCRDAMNDDSSRERRLIDRLVAPRILILSDPIPPRGTLTEYQVTMLFRVLDGRYRECRPTWVSLNVRNGEEADERMGAQLADRLRDGALCIHCDWPSYRKPLGSE
jgi:DNA replication protein DnaC